ncbi:MAG: hypothetical protein LV479_08015 [Methylacidiphilales bacterium]|nr:hypothetical protein [Candidatus Methylacidiphilales bacterium]
MKTLSRLASGALLCLLLTSCVVTSDNPLSSPETAKPDPRLVGDWFTKAEGDVFHFTITHGAWMHVVITSKADNRPGMIDRKPEEYDFFPTVIGNETFLNVRLIDKDKQGHPLKTYTFLRYSISPDRILRMEMISQDAVAEAVRAGKLKGTIHQDKNPLMVGQPAHPDIDVTLHDSTSRLFAFLRDSNRDTLFSGNKDNEPLYPVDSK